MTILVTCHIGLTFQKFGHIMSDACPTVIPSTIFQQPQPRKKHIQGINNLLHEAFPTLDALSPAQ